MNTYNLQLMNEKYIQDFECALNIYENEYSHDELINFLKEGSVAQKQAAVIKLDRISSKTEAKILLENLTGCDGKIREAVSFRLKEFVKINPEFYLEFTDVFLDAIIDINGNICRNTIYSVSELKKFKDFSLDFTSKLAQSTITLAKQAKDFDIQDGKYKINKEIFKLYWYLETISEFTDCIKTDILFEILSNSKDVKDYTIREKTAKILSKLSDNIFNGLKQELKKDNNYYVRRKFHSNN